MKAAILAAGEGKRLRKILGGVPKPLLKICGKALIERLIFSLVKNNISDIVVIIRKDAVLLKNFLENLRNKKINITLVERNTKSGMWSLFELEPFLSKENFFLFTADIVYKGGDLKNFIDFCRRNQNADLIIAVTPFILDEKPVFAKLDEKNRLIAVGRRYLKSGEFVTAGMMYCSPKIFKEREEALKNNIEHLSDFLGWIVKKGYYAIGFPISKVIDVDDERDVEEAKKFLNCE